MVLIHLYRFVSSSKLINFRNYSQTVKIGNVVKTLNEPKNKELIPINYLDNYKSSQLFLRHLKWMLQKDILGQDIFLIGPPGSYKRRLAMAYAELTQRETEYISLSRDTTESDLKQRREIIGKSALYFDQGAMRAATNGRLLILDGIEKAERNVLPILNNLLENREMQLEDGRFLMRSNIFDSLLSKYTVDEMENWKFLRCHEEFRVIALGLPVPKFRGNPLDPPLRSRFQSRHIDGESIADITEKLQLNHPKISKKRLNNLLSFIQAIHSDQVSDLDLPYFPKDNVLGTISLLEQFPELTDMDLISMIYPYKMLTNDHIHKFIDKLSEKFDINLTKSKSKSSEFFISKVENNHIELEQAKFSLLSHSKRVLKANATKQSDEVVRSVDLIETDKIKSMLGQMALLHSLGDFCVIGDSGCGKSSLVEHFAESIGLPLTHVVLYSDMTSRDLLQQRDTDPSTGDTIWRPSALVRAALQGHCAVLDGLHRLERGSVSLLGQLAAERELVLFDGARLLREDRFEKARQQIGDAVTEQDMNERGIYRIHPDFRMIGLAEPPLIPGQSQTQGASKQVDWLTAETLSTFRYFHLPSMSRNDEQYILRQSILRSVNEELDEEKLDLLLAITHRLRESEDNQIRDISQNLSLRQLIRIAHRLCRFPQESVKDAVKQACLYKFLPRMAHDSLNQILDEFDEEMHPSSQKNDESHLQELLEYYKKNLDPHRDPGSLMGQDLAKIPSVLFYDSKQHTKILLEMAKDFIIGLESGHHQHLLLIGNQGVGKNKISDRFLEMLGRPREYIQLHRDTTVQTLTLQPSIKDGRLVYEDSPLVRAITHGNVLVIDEADKASTQVTCVLKNLLTLGDMELSDGRRIVPTNRDLSKLNERDRANLIPIHPNFRMIVLANRPGFPFLGNDFYGAMGDVFSCHAVDNPDLQSEIKMLEQYGPSVPKDTIKKLVYLFSDLRSLADEGQIQYPYSTREIVNIVKHLDKYPSEPLSSVLGNVFDFDASNKEMLSSIESTLEKHGISLAGSTVRINLGKDEPLPPLFTSNIWRIQSPNSSSDTIKTVNEQQLNFQELTLQQPHPIRSQAEISRSRVFSQLSEGISFNLGEYNVISDLIATSTPTSSTIDGKIANTDNQPDNFIHFVTLNPISLTSLILPSGSTSITPASVKQMTEIDLSEDAGLFPQAQGAFRPSIRLMSLPHSPGEVLLHEGCTNTVLKINVYSGSISQLNSNVFLPEKSFKKSIFSHSVSSLYASNQSKTNAEQYYLHRNLEDVAVFHQPGNNSVHLFDTVSSKWSQIQCSFPIRSIKFMSRNQCLINSMDKKLYLATRLNDTEEFSIQNIDVRNPFVLLGQFYSKSMHSSSLHPSLRIETEIEEISGSKVTFSTDQEYLCSLLPPLNDLTPKESEHDILSIPRKQPSDKFPSIHPGSSCILPESSIIINSVTKSTVPREFQESASVMQASTTSISGYLEIINLNTNSYKYLAVPSPYSEPNIFRWLKMPSMPDVFIARLSDSTIVSLDGTGCLNSWTLCPVALDKELGVWKKGLGWDNEDRNLNIERSESEVDTSLSDPKHGKIDQDNAPHVGGNTWAGGTGGRDTAGLGGMGGPYRLDAGHDVYQVPDNIKQQVPNHVKEAAREMAQKAWKDRLRNIQMSELDHDLYMKYFKRVEPQINSIKVLIDTLQAASKERQWLRHKTHGDLDDGKLVEGVLGERTIYRARGDREPEPGTPQQKPKRIRVLADVSGSMYRFNGHDHRLERQLESVLMLMESFAHASPDKLVYDIYGHSGEGPKFEFVKLREPPTNEKQRMDVLMSMLAHSQFCLSGDHTLEGITSSSKDLRALADSMDESILIVVSDANLSRYGIRPQSLSRLLTPPSSSSAGVQTFVVFVGSLGNQASALKKELPAGRSFICLDTKELPNIMRTIFTSSLLAQH